MTTKYQDTPTSLSDSQQDALPNKAISLDIESPIAIVACFLCNGRAYREDRHQRFWCVQHAPQKAWLLPGVKSFLEGTQWEQGKDSRDARYKECKWYNYNKQDGPASQSLDFALQRDYNALGLRWYTDELIQMFEDNPVQAKKWTMQVHDAYVSGNTLRLEMLSRQIMATHVNVQMSKEDTSKCYLCGKGVENLDLHGRAYCSQHYPSNVEKSTEVQKTLTIVELCLCGNVAEGFYSATTGDELCQDCWSKEG